MALCLRAVFAEGQSPPTLLAPLPTVEINLPAYRLEVVMPGEPTRRYPVAIGMRKYKTPTGTYELTEVVWNPWWTPPQSEWAAKDTVTPPGPTNPMGRVKLQFGDLLYVHGTPFPTSVGHAASHGCLRMRNADAIELAILVQRLMGLPLDSASVDTLTVQARETRRVSLPSGMRVDVVYRIVEVRDSTLTLYPDVYRRRVGQVVNDVLAALASAGIDTSGVDPRRVRQLASRAVRRPVSAPVGALLTSATTR
ncbi:MAG: L,D-transpeptidase [Gemmatimonadaceae bacterium]